MFKKNSQYQEKGKSLVSNNKVEIEMVVPNDTELLHCQHNDSSMSDLQDDEVDNFGDILDDIEGNI